MEDTITTTSQLLLREGITIDEFETSSKWKDFILTVNNRSFHINEDLYLLISLINGRSSTKEISEKYSELMNKKYTELDIQNIVEQFLAPYGIITDNLIRDSHESKKKTYLRFRFQLIPSDILKVFTQYLGFLFDKPIFFLLNGLILILHFSIFFSVGYGNVQEIMHAPETFVFAMVVTLLSVLIHEFGHASATNHYNVDPGAIGFGVYLYFPVFFSDVSQIWRINKFQRAVVDYAGMYFQYLFNLVLFCVFLITNTKIFFYSIIFIFLQSLSNLNPFFRFDGYWLVTDLLGIPNLRKKVRDVVKYYRDIILRKKCSKPRFLESIDPKSKFFFIIYVLSSQFFFLYIIISLSIFMFPMLQTYPEFLIHSYSQIRAAFSLSNYGDLGKSFYQVLMRSIPLFFIFFIVYKISLKLFQGLRKVIRKNS